MKANAPEKIYRTTTYLDNNRGKTVWKVTPVKGAENIEYVRKDAFIEKARVWLTITAYKNGEFCYNPRTLVDNFCKAMKRDFAKSLFDK